MSSSVSNDRHDSLIYRNINFAYPSQSAKSLQQLVYHFFKSSELQKKKNDIFFRTQLELKKGKSYALIAPNGTGKTTLFRLLSSILPGAIPAESYKTLSFIDSIPPFISNIKVEANLTIFQNINNFDDSPRMINTILKEAGLDELRGKRMEQLSSGMISRLCLALVKCNHADLYLLDEVMNFGDHEFKQKLATIIRQKKEAGCTIIQAGHHLEELSKSCDHVLHINNKQLSVFDDLGQFITFYQNPC